MPGDKIEMEVELIANRNGRKAKVCSQGRRQDSWCWRCYKDP